MKVKIAKVLSTLLAIAFVFMSLNIFVSPISKNVSAATRTISATASTTILMTDGIQNHTMTNVTADGYETQAFPAQTSNTKVFLSYVNFSIIVSIEKYYQFNLWTGDLGTETNASAVMMKIGDLVIGNKLFNSIGSGNASSFVGLSRQVTIGEVRILPGAYTVQLINMINKTSVHYTASENYIGFVVTPTSRLLQTLQYTFALIADLHFTNQTGGQNVYTGTVDWNGFMFNYSNEINEAWVAQVNNMDPKPAFAVILGDLINIIAPQDYIDLRILLDKLTMPYYVVPGNHDTSVLNPYLTPVFDDLFPEWTGATFGHLYYYRDIQGTRFVFLDSRYAVNDGQISGAEQTWLNATLSTNLPTYIFQHHPLHSGSWDTMLNAADIRAILEAHDNVIADFSGHGHNEWIYDSGGIRYVETPCIIQYPFFYTVIDYFIPVGSLYTGSFLNINRYQLNYSNMSRNLHQSSHNENTSAGIGDTVFIQYLGDATFIGGPQILSLINIIFVMFAIGIVVGVVIEGTNSIRKQKMLTPGESIRMLFDMVIYIVIGMAGLGIMYGMLRV